MTEDRKRLVVLTGPTAVGKTALSVRLAKALDGEIISADSMQVYKYMDIGSAKVTLDEMDGVPHHLIDVLDPREEFNVTRFQAMAKEALAGIYARGHLPIIVGGTGFYIQALLYDIDFKDNDDNHALRAELEAQAAERGAHYMHERLREIDPASADAIHENNKKRVIRAIEYYLLTGQRISEHNEEERAKRSPYDFYYYVLTCDRALLYERIERRVDEMLAQGLVEEVRNLKALGLARGTTSMQGLGYKEILDYLDGRCTLDEAVYVLKRETRHFAKRQLTWFRRERDVRFLKLEDFNFDRERILAHICGEVKGRNKTNGNREDL